jgi:hypothetical protein
VQIILDAVSLLDTRSTLINQRGTGDALYPPAMKL